MKTPFDSAKLGLAIAFGAVRAVAVRDGHVIWASEAVRLDESLAALDAALRECLAAAPRRRWGRTPVTVAVGPHAAQMRLLTELPPFQDPRALARVVEESTSRFFLRNGVPLVTTGVRIAAPGEAWGAAFEQPLADAIGKVCRDERLALRGIAPTVVVLGAALDEKSLVWRDGPVIAQLTLAGGRITGLRRMPSTRPDEREIHGAGGTPLRLATPLAAFGEHALRYADAYGAALLPRDEAVVLRPGSMASPEGGAPRWRIALASIACALSIIAALLAPGIAASRESRHAEQVLAEMAPTRRNIAVTSRELQEVTLALNEIAGFGNRRRSATLFLEALTGALPSGAAVVALRTDSAGGNLMALAPRAAGVLSGLDSVSAIAAPEIIGPVTREAVGIRELERVTIRFRWSNGARPQAKRSQ